MYPDWVWLLGLAVFLWLGILTFLIWKQGNFFKTLFPKSGDRDIRRKFEEVLKQVENFEQDLDKHKSRLSEIEKSGLEHIQRVKLLRYNPYDETGGDQSFTLALLDDQGSGFVITSLHARSGTRIFAKPVSLGKSTKYKFSKEEEEVIREALKNG